jgi:5,5'-dehydrodivanillate O-demethylase
VETNDQPERRRDDVKLLHESAAGTLMGKLLRRFWHPIARSALVEPGQARPVRILGEDLTLYRGASGRAYLVGGRCAHRRTTLHTGHVEDDQLRCMYHGWRYDGTGLCTQIPAEKRARTYEVRIAAYPVHEYSGMVFAYMGESPAPPFGLPRKDFLEKPGCHIFVREAIWDCNWFQQIENSLDAVHVSFVHVWGKVSRYGEEISTAIPELAYAETAAGIQQTATRSKSNVRISDWTFPNNNHIVQPGPNKGDPWSHTYVWAVPIDDHRTLRFTVYAFDAAAADVARQFAEDPDREFNPADHAEQLFGAHKVPQVSAPEVLSAQDYVAIRGQGIIADRSRELLSTSDAGIVLLRRVFLRELEAIGSGQPTKQWTKLDNEVHMTIPQPEIA